MIKVNTLDYIIILVMGLYLISGLLDGLLKQVAGLSDMQFLSWGHCTGANLWEFCLPICSPPGVPLSRIPRWV